MSDQTEDSPDAEDEDDRRRIAGIIGAGAAGGASGGLAAAALSSEALAAGEAVAAAATTGVGPAGVPMAHVASAGPSGVAFDAGAVTGPTGTSIGQGAAGTTGVAIGDGAAVGPTGVPMTTFIRAHRVPFIVGAAVVATFGIGAVVVSAHRDDPPARSAVATTDSVAAPAVAATAAPATDAPTTAAAVEAVPVESVAEASTSTAVAVTAVGPVDCVVGSWVADNQVFGYSFGDLSGGQGSVNQITGSVVVDIAAGGAVVTTYNDWVMSADLQGVPGVVSMTGADTNTIVFDDDGSYAVTASQIGSHLTATSGGLTVIDGPSLQAIFQGSGTYTCAGDELQMTIPNSAAAAVFTRIG